MAKVKCPKCAHLNESSTTHCKRCGATLPSISFEVGAPKARPRQATPDSALQLRRGQVLDNRYTVLDLIGRGGMGCIYKVHDNVLGEDLALKTLLPQFVTDKTVSDRFLNEARITRKLAHPNIVRMHDIGKAGKGIYISMEYVEGDSLRALLEKQPPGQRLPVRQVLHIIEQLCVALDYAHQYTIHRDIKPENVMLTRENRIKLMDFGISKLMDNRFATAASMVMGTPYYMSPEQLRNSRDVDARADIYSVGVVLYELLTGNMPTGVPRPASQMLKDIPPALDDIVARCVDPDREKRFESAAALCAALRPIIELLDSGKDPVKALSKKYPGPSGTALPPRLVLAAVLAVIALAATGFALWSLERWNYSTAVTPISPAALHTLAGAQTERFDELGILLVAAEESATAIANPSRRQRALIADANARREQARDAALAGDNAAIPHAEDALQHYLAALMLPEAMVFVPAGTVTIGGNALFVPGFFMDTTEVTLGQYATFCREVRDGWQMPLELRDRVEDYADHPVSYVAWYDAQAYAAWAGKALPSRAQWARAAYGAPQAVDTYPWGTEWKNEAANLQGQNTMPVRSFEDDRCWSGCYDMLGNVMEWTRTYADQEKDATQSPPDFGDTLLACGGSYRAAHLLHTVTAHNFNTRAPDLGFRCGLEIPTNVDAVRDILRATP